MHRPGRGLPAGLFALYRVEPGLEDDIRRATNGNFALGNERFADEVAAALRRRAVPGAPGRPRKQLGPASGDLFEG